MYCRTGPHGKSRRREPLYKSGWMKRFGLGYWMLLKGVFLLALFLFARHHGMF
jgi:hypothetical protein